MVWSRYANGWKQITTQSSPLLYPRKQKQRTADQGGKVIVLHSSVVV